LYLSKGFSSFLSYFGAKFNLNLVLLSAGLGF
jgi:hypothetical protein